MNVAPATRRANLWLFVGLVVFALALCALVLLWMRARTHAEGGKVYPPVGVSFFCHPERSAAESKDLPMRYTPTIRFDARSRTEGTILIVWEVLRLRACGTPLRMTEFLDSSVETEAQNSPVEIAPVIPLIAPSRTPVLL